MHGPVDCSAAMWHLPMAEGHPASRRLTMEDPSEWLAVLDGFLAAVRAGRGALRMRCSDSGVRVSLRRTDYRGHDEDV
jgi:hypothetical protein